MPNIKSAKKRMRQNGIRRMRNRSRLSQMRTVVKRFRKSVDQQNFDEARELLPSVYGTIDRTAQKGSIHPGTAARYKSRLTRLLNKQAAPSD